VVTYLTVASEQPGEVGTQAKAALADLEQLDPEGVKRARSLMAFGFLARARDAKPAATGAQRVTDVVVTANEGFAAGAADGAEEDADPSDIPNPAEFDEARKEIAAPANEPASDAVEQQVAKPAPEQPIAPEVAPPPAPMAYSRPVVIGVPLALAFVLATVYWLILRWGAM
jgi:hypothetical protein